MPWWRCSPVWSSVQCRVGVARLWRAWTIVITAPWVPISLLPLLGMTVSGRTSVRRRIRSRVSISSWHGVSRWVLWRRIDVARLVISPAPIRVRWSIWWRVGANKTITMRASRRVCRTRRGRSCGILPLVWVVCNRRAHLVSQLRDMHLTGMVTVTADLQAVGNESVRCLSELSTRYRSRGIRPERIQTRLNFWVMLMEKIGKPNWTDSPSSTLSAG